MTKMMMTIIIIITSIGRGYISQLQPPTDLLFISRQRVSMENNGEMISTGED
jgi:hypothetical protein